MDEETREKLRAEQREKLEDRRHSTKHQKDARTIALMVDMPVELMIATHESPRIMGKAIDTAQQLIRKGLVIWPRRSTPTYARRRWERKMAQSSSLSYSGIERT